ncbi:hypothetical protein BACCOPRO_00612 [Phocaeicola coprophilus DSM 18228 = JCM 13818]|uniref:Uncharacterized protein n=1 Tax=Phocaeicola coprophilus DSM 18228 = JCM 13818 TaxID=547042 RepID=S0F4X7_9BACT|nr:hypothetical protein BACCOPRO_00612 [Phocaeicola coprophilus DSM 18228 = JCM 13818]
MFIIITRPLIHYSQKFSSQYILPKFRNKASSIDLPIADSRKTFQIYGVKYS